LTALAFAVIAFTIMRDSEDEYLRITKQNELTNVIDNYSNDYDRVLYVGIHLNIWYPHLVQMNRYVSSPYLTVHPLHYAALISPTESVANKPDKRIRNIIGPESEFDRNVKHVIATQKPNLILIATEELGFDTIGYLGSSGLISFVEESYSRLPQIYRGWRDIRVAVYVLDK
jgi:hypothetical protein